ELRSAVPVAVLRVLRRPPTASLFPYTTLFRSARRARPGGGGYRPLGELPAGRQGPRARRAGTVGAVRRRARGPVLLHAREPRPQDRKSTRLNSSHVSISYAVFCLLKKRAAVEH